MDVRFVTDIRGDAIAIAVPEGGLLGAQAQSLDARTQGQLSRALSSGRFTGAAGQALEVLAPAGLEASRVVLAGVGPADKVDGLAVERWAGACVRRVATSGAERLSLLVEGTKAVTAAEASARAALGARLAGYRFDRYRTRMKAEQKQSLLEVQVVTDAPAAAQSRYDKDSVVVDGVLWARDLVSEPANILHPEEFARRCKALDALGLEIEILGEEQMRAAGMGALVGVGQGSVRESQLVVMSWKGLKTRASQPIALVGKGVTFDTGGISLKPGPGMEDMRGDMGGAAAVAGAMMAIAKRKAKANVVGVIGLVENMPDGNAQRPGDIVTSMSGQTIEVLNTDAEGRLVLADAMWYAQEKHNPTVMIDLATLTGAIIVSLGHEHAGLFSNNDELAHGLQAAGAAEGEPVWRLPLGPAYDRLIDSANADIKNVAGKPAAGSIVAAQFLQRFVKPGVAWAHIDIAGTAWKPMPGEDPVSPAWATGYGVRLLNRLIASQYEE